GRSRRGRACWSCLPYRTAAACRQNSNRRFPPGFGPSLATPLQPPVSGGWPSGEQLCSTPAGLNRQKPENVGLAAMTHQPGDQSLLNLDQRSRDIFRLIVDSYLKEGEPIGSRSLSRMLPQSLSPATIRNVMS